MKTTLILLSLFSLQFLACDGNDEAAFDPTSSTQKRYLSKVTVDFDYQILFEYNSEKKIHTITSPKEQIQVEYEYENGRVSKIHSTIGTMTLTTEFKYDKKGILYLFKRNDQSFPIDYLPNENAYRFTLDGGQIKVYLNQNNDVSRYVMENEADPIEFNITYDEGLGSLGTTQENVIQNFIGMHEGIYFYFLTNFNLSNSPINSIDTPSGQMTFQNFNLGKQGLLSTKISSPINDEGDIYVVNAAYEYVQL